jgi:hypothetical protein
VSERFTVDESGAIIVLKVCAWECGAQAPAGGSNGCRCTCESRRE